VFVAGMPGVPYSWRGFTYHWPNKQWPRELVQDLETKMTELGTSQPSQTFWYKAECTPGPLMITRGLGGVPGLVASKCAEEKYDFIKEMSSVVNHKVAGVLSKASRIPFDIISLDYVHDDIIDRIVELNVRQGGQPGPARMMTSEDNMMTSETVNSDEYNTTDPTAADGEEKVPIGAIRVQPVEVWESTM
jgi:hypothetical protein